MINILKCLLSFTLILPLLAYSGADDSFSQSQSIQKLIDQYHDRYQSNDTKTKREYISAIQLSTYHNGHTHTYVAGSLGHEISQPVSENSLFGWGSITKEFTAAVILRLQERGAKFKSDFIRLDP